MAEGSGYSVERMGDEYTFTYFQCEPCGQWYEESVRDVFCGPEQSMITPISEDEMAVRLETEP